MSTPAQGSELRKHPRLSLPPMYTLVRVRPTGQASYKWTGHIYDISESGMRIELDNDVADGTVVDLRAMLPGVGHTTIRATARVVRRHDDVEDRGPVRMGVTFERFDQSQDRRTLREYIAQRAAA